MVRKFKVCNCGGTLACIDSRPVMAYSTPSVRRRYKCLSCDARYTTAEFFVIEGDSAERGGHRPRHATEFIDALIRQGEDAARARIRAALGEQLEKI